MPEYYLSKKAVEDLSAIWNYTFDHWSESQADKYYQMLLDSCQRIENHPNIGREYDGVAPDLLGFKAQKTYYILQNRSA